MVTGPKRLWKVRAYFRVQRLKWWSQTRQIGGLGAAFFWAASSIQKLALQIARLMLDGILQMAERLVAGLDEAAHDIRQSHRELSRSENQRLGTDAVSPVKGGKATAEFFMSPA